MNYLYFIFLLIITLLSVSNLRKNLMPVNWNFNPHPFYFLFAIKLIPIISGVYWITVANAPLQFNSHLGLSHVIKTDVMFYFFLSLLSLLLLLKLTGNVGFNLSTFDDIKDHKRVERFIKLILIFATVIFTIQLLSLPAIPLLSTLSGDFEGAAEQKLEILQRSAGVKFGPFNYVLKYIVLYAYFLCFFYFLKTRRLLLPTIYSFILAVAYSIYDVQKSFLIIILLATVWLYLVCSGKLLKTAVIGIVFAFISILSFKVMTDESGQINVLEFMIYRIFVAQSEGMYFIFNYLVPDTKYLWNSFPLASQFGLVMIDPAAEVVKIVFPGASDSWLNVNSYYIAHAWALFGYAGIIIGPIIIFINLFSVFYISKLASKSMGILIYPLNMVAVIDAPIINTFTEFLYGKFLLGFLINMFFIYIMWKFLKITQTGRLYGKFL